MKSTKSKQPITLLVLRDAQHSVKQIQLSKPLLIAVPTIAILSLSGLIISMQVHSSQLISKMEQQLHLQTMTNNQMEVTVSNRDEAISRLQNEIINLSSDAQDMKGKMLRVNDLEKELQKFIHNNTSKISEKVTIAPTITKDNHQHIGGEFIAVDTREILDLTRETKDDFEKLRELLDSMENSIPRMLEQAQETQDMLAGIPNMWPTTSHVVSSSFGYRKDPFKGMSAFHAGLDISGNTGDPVYAAGAGTVVEAEHRGAPGLYIKIEHPEGLHTTYMHLSKINVAVGESIAKGELIGEMGSTGRSTGSHLHFQVEKQNKVVNPLPYIQ